MTSVSNLPSLTVEKKGLVLDSYYDLRIAENLPSVPSAANTQIDGQTSVPAVQSVVLNYAPTFANNGGMFPQIAGYPFYVGVLADEWTPEVEGVYKILALKNDYWSDLDNNLPITVVKDSWSFSPEFPGSLLLFN